MKVLEANAGLLTNFEVLALLRNRGADKGSIGGFISAAECKVYEYLMRTSAGTQSRQNIEEFSAGAKLFNLTNAEHLQAINLRPSTAVEVHLIVEDCDERLSSSQVERFCETIADTLPPPPEKAGQETEGAAEDDNDEGNVDMDAEVEAQTGVAEI